MAQQLSVGVSGHTSSLPRNVWAASVMHVAAKDVPLPAWWFSLSRTSGGVIHKDGPSRTPAATSDTHLQ